nr:hypothetical protein GCM10020093_037840 [Planobispora longispora]
MDLLAGPLVLDRPGGLFPSPPGGRLGLAAAVDPATVEAAITVTTAVRRTRLLLISVLP